MKEIEIAVKKIKDYFEIELAKALNLIRVSAPMFVTTDSGLNDNLSGVERPVTFDMKNSDRELQIVHSLAKWKRAALQKYDFQMGEGLYTDMNAIRRDEDLDEIHSIYVDQWDWEVMIQKEERTMDFLHQAVRKIFGVFKETETYITTEILTLEKYLPEEVTFITSEELLKLYPTLSSKERENEIAKKTGAIFISQIGNDLSDGKKHDKRAPDYDDWDLNGDLLFWSPVLQKAVEISSMGIRVDENSLVSQIEKADCKERLKLPYHEDVIHKRLPYTIGGGIGQSRICMFLLGKSHIGEVQSSIWDQKTIDICKEKNINLL